jgi:VCBS repeat-containing protein
VAFLREEVMKKLLMTAVILSLLLVLVDWNPAYGAGQSKLGHFLKKLHGEFKSKGEGAAKRLAERRMKLRRDRQGKPLVPVIIEPQRGTGSKSIDLARIEKRGGKVDAVSRDFARILVPFRLLKRLEGLPDVRIARAPTPAKALAVGTGSNVSESVHLTGAEDLQLAGTTGAGIKVAVVDLGYIGLNQAIGLGELPPSTVIADLPGSYDDDIETETKHGVGVAEQIMDMAPGAALHCIMVSDEVDLQNAADYIRNNNIRITNHSVGWVNASYYDDTGVISGIFNQLKGDGTFCTVSAGNEVEYHWRGGWSDPEGNDELNFQGSDEELDLLTSSTYVSVFLNWNQYGNVETDLDLYVVDNRGNDAGYSENDQWGNPTLPPTESVSFQYLSRRAPYRIQVSLWRGPTTVADGLTKPLDITIFSFYNKVEHNVAQASLMDPACASGAFSVGAIWRGDWNEADPPPEAYSSQGPTTDGRLKPDLMAPDGTTSWTYGFQDSWGTSFSAPIVAGAAALLLEQNPFFTADDLAETLRNTAIDVGAQGWDTVYGMGKLNLEAAPNDPPLAEDDTAATAEDTPTEIDVLGNDSDPNGDPLTVDSVTQGANGSVEIIDAGARVRFTPAPDWSGTDTFSYTITDGKGGFDTAWVTVTVTAENDPPMAVDDGYTATEGITLSIPTPGVLVNDYDVDSPMLTAVKVADPAHGGFTLNADGSFTYTPDPGFHGTDSFTYKANDSQTTSNVATVTITVLAVNDPPVANDDTATAAEDTPVTITVLANDSDPDGDPLAVQSVTLGAHGSVARNPDNTVTYTPDFNFNGTDAFTYTITDGKGGTDSATVNVTITPVNDGPIAVDDAYNGLEDNMLSVGAPGVLGNDSDPEGQPMTAVRVAGPSNGVLTLSDDGSFTYTPSADFSGTDSFTYKASDGQAEGNVATVTITVAPANDPPFSVDDSYDVDEDTVLNVPAPGVLGNDADIDGDPVTAVLVDGPANGSLTLNGNGSFIYTPQADYFGTDAFTYRASDGQAGGNVATVTITVHPVNDPPVSIDDSYNVDEDTVLNVPAPGVLGNDDDVDGDLITAELVNGPANGVLTLNDDGSFTYTPGANFSGTDSFTYKASDWLVDGNTATVTIAVNPVNDPPVATADGYSVNENDTLSVAAPGVLGNDSDPDSDPMTAVKASDPSHGTLTLNADGSFTYTPYPDYTGADSFSYRVFDGALESGTTTVTIAVNPAPSGTPPFLETGIAVSGPGWKTVTLSHTYASMVVVCNPNYSSSEGPAVARVRNAAGGSFEFMVAKANGSSAALSGITVHYMVVEEGSYNEAQHGVTMEAVRYLSTKTDRKSSWGGEQRSYQNTYTQPVVLGQVMTANDPDWSAFWCCGSAKGSPPNSVLKVGKHVGEDPDKVRDDETIGYIVIEAGSGTVGTASGPSLPYVAGLGGDTIRGIQNSPPFSYSISGISSVSTAIACQAAMDGGNGGWALLYGSNPVTTTALNLAIDEDQANDTERKHTTEQVAYMVFAEPPPTQPVIGLSPASLNFTAQEGGANPPGQTLQVWNAGEGTLNWTAAEGEPWLHIDKTSGSSTGSADVGTIQVTVDAAGLSAGTYTGTIIVSDAAAANSPQTVDVRLNVQAEGQDIIYSVGTFDINSISYGDLPNGVFGPLTPGGLSEAQVRSRINSFMDWILGLGFTEVDLHVGMAEGMHNTDEYYYYFPSPTLENMNQTTTGKQIIHNDMNRNVLPWIMEAADQRQMTLNCCLEMFGALGANVYSGGSNMPDFTPGEVAGIVTDLKAIGAKKINEEGFYLDMLQANPPDYMGPIAAAAGPEMEYLHLFDEPRGLADAYGSEDFDIYPRNSTEHSNFLDGSDIGHLNVMFGHARALGKPAHVLTWGEEADKPASWQRNRCLYRTISDDPVCYSWGGALEQENDYLRGNPPGFDLNGMKADIAEFRAPLEQKPICNLILDVPDDGQIRLYFTQPETGMMPAVGNALAAAGYEIRTTYVGPDIVTPSYLPDADIYYYVGYGSDGGAFDDIDGSLYAALINTGKPVVFHAGSAPTNQGNWSNILQLFGINLTAVDTRDMPASLTYKGTTVKWKGYEIAMWPIMAKISSSQATNAQVLLEDSGYLVIAKENTGKYLLVNSNIMNLEATFVLADVLAGLHPSLSSPAPLNDKCFAYIHRGKRTVIYAGDNGHVNVNIPGGASSTVRFVQFSPDGTRIIDETRNLPLGDIAVTRGDLVIIDGSNGSP